MPERRALIWGISGQDGAYLAALLIGQGYEVHGTTRGPLSPPPSNLVRLGIDAQVRLHQVDPGHAAPAAEILEHVRPDEIYYLAAQSSVARSFDEPVETFRAAALGLVSVLAAARSVVPHARTLYAASGDCFGDAAAEAPAVETTKLAPRSPYAAAKCAGHHAVAASRIASGQFACSAFLFTHESPLRPEAFAFGKIAAAVRRIRDGSTERLSLGSIDIVRDWGFAPEYVDAMHRMLQQPEPTDFVIATGRSSRLAEFVELAFAQAGLEWRDHTDVSPTNPRPADIVRQYANPARARELLGWEAKMGLEDIARAMVLE